MAVNNILGLGRATARAIVTPATKNTNGIYEAILSIDDKIVEELFQAAQKNKTGIFRTRPWNCDVRTLDEIGTALTRKEQLRQKICDLAAKYKMERKTLKINGEEKEFTIYKGSQSGSNEGYWARIRGTDELYYIKYGNEAQIRSEQLAGELYELGGIPSTQKTIVSYAAPTKYAWQGPQERIGIASRFMPINYLPTKEEASIVREGFGLDCWLANWDALKRGNVVMSGGNAARLDVGGALCFRARGGRKGAAFGENVGELTSFFDNLSLSKPFIKDMTRKELIESLERVSKIPDSKIIETVDKAAAYKQIPAGIIPAHTQVTGVQNPEYLKEILIERRNYISRFRELCRDIPQKEGESIEEYIRRIDKLALKKEYRIPFEKIEMSTEVTDGVKGISMAERLTPSQKKIYEDSLAAFNNTKAYKISHPEANEILTENSMLHATSYTNIDEILTKGITTGDLRGSIGSGTGCATQTPLCADFWDVQNRISIKDYFARQKFNPGESNFLPRTTPGGLSNTRDSIVFVVDKNHVSSTIMQNSFKVCEGGKGSILYKDGNMAGHANYITHRAVPIGVPANAINRIIIRKECYSPKEIQQIKCLIKYKDLDIKLYDLEGHLL